MENVISCIKRPLLNSFPAIRRVYFERKKSCRFYVFILWTRPDHSIRVFFVFFWARNYWSIENKGTYEFRPHLKWTSPYTLQLPDFSPYSRTFLNSQIKQIFHSHPSACFTKESVGTYYWVPTAVIYPHLSRLFLVCVCENVMNPRRKLLHSFNYVSHNSDVATARYLFS